MESKKRKRTGSSGGTKFSKKGKQTFKSTKRQNVLLGAEKKFFDTSSVTDASTTVTVVNLNNMAAGDTALTRDGNKILCKSCQFRITLENESLAQNTIVRFVLVHDKNANGVAPTGAQVFEGTPNVYSMKSVANASRFITLWDETIVLNNSSDTAGAFQKGYIEKYISIPQHLQLSMYADGTAVVPTSGSLSLLYLSDVASGATDVNIIDNNRLRFVG